MALIPLSADPDGVRTTPDVSGRFQTAFSRTHSSSSSRTPAVIASSIFDDTVSYYSLRASSCLTFVLSLGSDRLIAWTHIAT